MRRLTCIRERDQGAIAAIVAMLFGFGVLLSLAALTVDVGNINADRRQLQNGADAVALSVAQQCAKTATCAPTDPNLQTLANANAADGATSIRRVDGTVPVGTSPGAPAICGNAPDGSLPACPAAWTPGISTLQECPSAPASGNYVQVYAETKNSNNQNILPYYFGAAITGISGANQQACARAAWGPPYRGGTSLPVTVSLCEWNNLTTNGTRYVAGGPYNDPFQTPDPSPGVAYPAPGPSTYETRLLFHDESAATHCPAGPSGADLPGGFGWLETAGGGCAADVQASGWVNDKPGNSVPRGCNLAPIVGTVAYVPIYKNTNGLSGRNGSYLIDGFAAFYVTGYSIPADRPKSIATNARLCTPSQTCLYGWFTQGIMPVADYFAGPGGGGTPRGAIGVSLSG